MKIYTLGTANRQHFDFTKILNKYGIQVVLDIRRSPTSPAAPQFNRDSLQMLCASQKADYIYLGNDLGRTLSEELRPSRLEQAGPGGMQVLKDWQASEEFKRTIDILSRKAETRVTCLLCSELMPSDCQRMFLTDLLAQRGFEIIHILDQTRLWSPPPGRRPGFGRRGPRARGHHHREKPTAQGPR